MVIVVVTVRIPPPPTMLADVDARLFKHCKSKTQCRRKRPESVFPAMCVNAANGLHQAADILVRARSERNPVPRRDDRLPMIDSVLKACRGDNLSMIDVVRKARPDDRLPMVDASHYANANCETTMHFRQWSSTLAQRSSATSTNLPTYKNQGSKSQDIETVCVDSRVEKSWVLHVRSLLASHQDELGTITGRVTPGFSHVGIVPNDTAGRRVFSGISRFPTLSFQRCSLLTSITLNGSQDLAVKSRPNLFTSHRLTTLPFILTAMGIYQQILRYSSRFFFALFAVFCRCLLQYKGETDAPPTCNTAKIGAGNRTPILRIVTFKDEGFMPYLEDQSIEFHQILQASSGTVGPTTPFVGTSSQGRAYDAADSRASFRSGGGGDGPLPCPHPSLTTIPISSSEKAQGPPPDTSAALSRRGNEECRPVNHSPRRPEVIALAGPAWARGGRGESLPDAPRLAACDIGDAEPGAGVCTYATTFPPSLPTLLGVCHPDGPPWEARVQGQEATRATLTRKPSAASLLRTRRAVFPLSRPELPFGSASTSESRNASREFSPTPKIPASLREPQPPPSACVLSTQHQTCIVKMHPHLVGRCSTQSRMRVHELHASVLSAMLLLVEPMPGVHSSLPSAMKKFISAAPGQTSPACSTQGKLSVLFESLLRRHRPTSLRWPESSSSGRPPARTAAGDLPICRGTSTLIGHLRQALGDHPRRSPRNSQNTLTLVCLVHTALDSPHNSLYLGECIFRERISRPALWTIHHCSSVYNCNTHLVTAAGMTCYYNGSHPSPSGTGHPRQPTGTVVLASTLVPAASLWFRLCRFETPLEDNISESSTLDIIPNTSDHSGAQLQPTSDSRSTENTTSIENMNAPILPQVAHDMSIQISVVKQDLKTVSTQLEQTSGELREEVILARNELETVTERFEPRVSVLERNFNDVEERVSEQMENFSRQVERRLDKEKNSTDARSHQVSGEVKMVTDKLDEVIKSVGEVRFGNNVSTLAYPIKRITVPSNTCSHHSREPVHASKLWENQMTSFEGSITTAILSIAARSRHREADKKRRDDNMEEVEDKDDKNEEKKEDKKKGKEEEKGKENQQSLIFDMSKLSPPLDTKSPETGEIDEEKKEELLEFTRRKITLAAERRSRYAKKSRKQELTIGQLVLARAHCVSKILGTHLEEANATVCWAGDVANTSSKDPGLIQLSIRIRSSPSVALIRRGMTSKRSQSRGSISKGETTGKFLVSMASFLWGVSRSFETPRLRCFRGQVLSWCQQCFVYAEAAAVFEDSEMGERQAPC
ncbi:hypothetical protein PR048_006310 [Dryococelus australis]|uniref:Uncharacterized protein n=1 Tax=Dryococelus australis TaxID=614101 RepID=A0ABQ9IBY6_9NEOP|nr:hypothetical protein PR048_006310 [Dryococelus australis]